MNHENPHQSDSGTPPPLPLNYATPDPMASRRKGCLLALAIVLGIFLLLFGLCIVALNNL